MQAAAWKVINLSNMLTVIIVKHTKMIYQMKWLHIYFPILYEII